MVATPFSADNNVRAVTRGSSANKDVRKHNKTFRRYQSRKLEPSKYSTESFEPHGID